jgi:hypothetical protein
MSLEDFNPALPNFCILNDKKHKKVPKKKERCLKSYFLNVFTAEGRVRGDRKKKKKLMRKKMLIKKKGN